MDISGIFSRVRKALRKTGGDDLDVLGRSDSVAEESVQGVPDSTDASSTEMAGEGASNAERQGSGSRHVLGGGDDELDEKTIARIKRRAKEGPKEDELVDHDLPSVNRRSKKSPLVGLAWVIAMVFFAYMALAAFNSPPRSANKVAPKQPAALTVQPEPVVNAMPPLVLPEPPAPLPVAETQQEAVRIPVKQLGPNEQLTLNEQPEPDWVQRKINSEVLLDTKKNNAVANDIPKSESGVSKPLSAKGDEQQDEQGELSRNLKSLVKTKPVSAGILPNRNFVIAKGTLLDCALETAIDSSLAGLVTCRLTRDIYSDNGRVIMLDRGSQLVGEYKSGIAEGMVRIFVLWTRAKTPKGVIIALDSPGTDALGRSGLEGFVDTHFIERFGAAIMMSVVQESLDYAKAQAG